MPLANEALVMVTDGRKMLFLRNEGDANHLDLRVEKHRERDDASDKELSTDKAGTVFQSGTTGRSGYEETDFHQLEEDRWAHEAAERLNKRALSNDFDKLAIIAPPKTLGELRKKLHKETEKRIVIEIDKEMTNQPIADIEKLLVEELSANA